MLSSLKLIKKLTKRALVVGGYLGYTACIVHCTSEYLGDIVICQGPSMEPTITSYDVILTEHVSIIKKEINRGDIIISRSPSNPKEFICKRVKGKQIYAYFVCCKILTSKYASRGATCKFMDYIKFFQIIKSKIIKVSQIIISLYK